MKKEKKLNLIIGAFTFVASIFLYPMIADELQNYKTWIVLTCFIAIALAMYFFMSTYKMISEISSWKDLKVKYINEFISDDGQVHEGRVFKELCEIILFAEKEIITVSSSFREGKKSKTIEHPQRKKYLSQLEKLLQKKTNSEFKYIRIHQFPKLLGHDTDLLTEMGELNFSHFKNALHLNKKGINEKFVVKILKVSTIHPASFMIIDKKYVVWQTNRIDKNSEPFASGAFLFEDNQGDFVKYLLNEYETLLSLSTPFEASDFA